MTIASAWMGKSFKVILSLRGSLMTLPPNSLKGEKDRRMCGCEKH